jgi:hypothetical protein
MEISSGIMFKPSLMNIGQLISIILMFPVESGRKQIHKQTEGGTMILWNLKRQQ